MAQKNILQYIILGLLRQEPKTGYEIKQAFENDIGEFWQAKHSQIYPELKRLENMELIDHDIVIVGKKMETKKYHILNSGVEFFLEWQFSDVTELTPNKDEFTLKLYFIEDKNDVHLRSMVNNQIELHNTKLNHLLKRKALLFDTSSKINAAYGHYLILKKALSREKDCIEWLNQI